QRIIDAAARQLKVPVDRFFSNLDRYGNTSAASIPIALCEAVDQGRIRPSDYVVLVGFGGGLTWGALALQWPEELPPEMGEWSLRRRRVFYTLMRWRERLQRLWWRIQVIVLGTAAPSSELEPGDAARPRRLPRLRMPRFLQRRKAPAA